MTHELHQKEGVRPENLLGLFRLMRDVGFHTNQRTYPLILPLLLVRTTKDLQHPLKLFFRNEYTF